MFNLQLNQWQVTFLNEDKSASSIAKTKIDMLCRLKDREKQVTDVHTQPD